MSPHPCSQAGPATAACVLLLVDVAVVPSLLMGSGPGFQSQDVLAGSFTSCAALKSSSKFILLRVLVCNDMSEYHLLLRTTVTLAAHHSRN